MKRGTKTKNEKLLILKYCAAKFFTTNSLSYTNKQYNDIKAKEIVEYDTL